MIIALALLNAVIAGVNFGCIFLPGNRTWPLNAASFVFCISVAISIAVSQ